MSRDDPLICLFETNALSEGRLFRLPNLFDTIRRAFRLWIDTLDDPILECRRFVWEPALEPPGIFPLFAGEILAWDLPPTAKTKALLAPDARGNRLRFNRVRGWTAWQERIYDEICEARVPGGRPTVWRFADDRDARFARLKRPPRFALFDDLEFEFLWRIGAVFRALQHAPAIEALGEMVVSARPPGRAADDLPALAMSHELFASTLLVDFERDEIHLLANRHPPVWRMFGHE